MNFQATEEEAAIRAAVLQSCAPFGEDYWLARDKDAQFPDAFYAAMAKAGWLGIAIPEAYGGSGLGVTQAAAMMQTVAATGACMAGCSSFHINIFGLMPIVVFGTDAQKKRFLPPVVEGRTRACFGVTEPNTGLNTTQLKTRAVLRGDRYVVHGQKVWISTAKGADKIMLLARTTPIEECKSHSHGLSLFYTDLDRSKVRISTIDKMGRHAVDSNELFIDGLEIPVEDLIGEEGKGFKYILHGMNPERVLLAAEAIGIGQVALRKASAYAAERVVFDRPIGKNQGIQHPLARNWMELEAA
ncbi:MAG: acyl-CoA dehydrogenase, partial [Comamonadaceae bacterium]